MCVSVRTKSESTRTGSNQALYVRVFHNECKVLYVWSLIKVYGSKVMTRNTFHGDRTLGSENERASLSSWAKYASLGNA